jgi:hypothetical protein
MNEIANHLLDVITRALPLLKEISDAEAAATPAPGKWSKKEIIGHLIDSACNNQMKFVRAMQQQEVAVDSYEQDFWVSSQAYNDENWQELLFLWEALNRHIAHLIEHVPASTLQHRISINGSEPFTLQFVIEDYPEHLKHHLKAILQDADFLQNSFKMVY